MINKKSIKKSGGFLLLIGVVLMILASGLIVSIGYFVLTQSKRDILQNQSVLAFYLAESGLQRAANDIVSGVTACNAITGGANYTNVTLGSGQFTATATVNNPTMSTLTANINSSTATIPLSSIAGYGSSGRVVIDSEMIDYNGTSTSAGICGTQPCLTGAIRGVSNTTAVNHVTGQSVGQNQCILTGTGGIPTVSSYTARRIVTEGVALPVTNFPQRNIAMVNSSGSSSHLYIDWDTTSWTRQNPALYPNLQSTGYNRVAIVDIDNVWAVGVAGASMTGPLIAHWNGTNWVSVPAPGVPKVTLRDILCLSSSDCRAVGDNNGSTNATLLSWNGSAWSMASINANVVKQPLYGLSCGAANNCWAVGPGGGSLTTPQFVNWNGTQWTRTTSISGAIPNVNLYDVKCMGTNNCWAVGALSSGAAVIARWNGTNWSQVTPGVAVPVALRAITCVSSTCYAVGDVNTTPYILSWNGGTGSGWARMTTSSLATQNLQDISCTAANSCWTVGNNASMGFWNGTSWSTTSAINFSSGNILGIDVKSGASYMQNVGLTKPVFGWGR